MRLWAVELFRFGPKVSLCLCCGLTFNLHFCIFLLSSLCSIKKCCNHSEIESGSGTGERLLSFETPKLSVTQKVGGQFMRLAVSHADRQG